MVISSLLAVRLWLVVSQRSVVMALQSGARRAGRAQQLLKKGPPNCLWDEKKMITLGCSFRNPGDI